MPQTIRSLHKALELVDEFARVGDAAGVSELARRLGLTKDQVFRLARRCVSRPRAAFRPNRALSRARAACRDLRPRLDAAGSSALAKCRIVATQPALV